ncbi:MAG: pyridoxamine 5'-phosphate oxidase family protein [Caldilineaceae bacterium]
MASWKEFTQQAADIAAFGKTRFQSRVGYLGTVRADGSPRVHPVTPIVGDELFLFMEPTSPKGKDLQRDGRYSLHCAVENMDGGGGEFYVSGRASLVTDPTVRQQAIQAASYNPRDRYILFRLTVESAFMNVYTDSGSNVQRWKE